MLPKLPRGFAGAPRDATVVTSTTLPSLSTYTSHFLAPPPPPSQFTLTFLPLSSPDPRYPPRFPPPVFSLLPSYTFVFPSSSWSHPLSLLPSCLFSSFFPPFPLRPLPFSLHSGLCHNFRILSLHNCFSTRSFQIFSGTAKQAHVYLQVH